MGGEGELMIDKNEIPDAKTIVENQLLDTTGTRLLFVASAFAYH
jgi:hypothetical protein